jgi:hypothetical protein
MYTTLRDGNIHGEEGQWRLAQHMEGLYEFKLVLDIAD